MDTLAYIQRAATYPNLKPEDFAQAASLALITNFTDDLLQKFLVGLSLENDIYPVLCAEPYKQYHFDLANPASPLYASPADVTFVVFDVNPYIESEFTEDDAHAQEILTSLQTYARHTHGHLVIGALPLPSQSPYGALHEEDPLYRRIAAFNDGLRKIVADYSNVSLLDTNMLFATWGEARARDMRGLYAYDVPFTKDFSFALARECVGYLLALKGRAKKCIVLDLDNTLWGGIVGETGPDGIALGEGYPGSAYRNFQRVLRSYWERGIILAVASRNNPEEIDAVFEKNSRMILKKEHFGSVQVNWRPKSESIKAIADELNIGLDALVFLDDDAANREEVRSALPMVAVPDMPANPEEYAPALLSYPYFTQMALTAEDREKGKMYAQERQRKEIFTTTTDPVAYLGKLGIEITLTENGPRQLPRLAQLSQKTNQLNLTTKRYTEKDLERLIAQGASVFGAEVRDKFGDYGLVALAIVLPGAQKETALDTFLMSCRTMGRGVEYAVLDRIIEILAGRQFERIQARFIPTTKNAPAKDILPHAGFSETTPGMYGLDISAYTDAKPDAVSRVLPFITIVSA